MISKLRFIFIAFFIGFVSLLAACGSAVKLDQAANASKGGASGTLNANVPTPLTPSIRSSQLDQDQSNPENVQQVDVDPLNDLNSPLAQRSIYFDFDDYTVKDEFQSLLQQHAQYLKSHPARQLRVQGNTDERGTSEYNIALGQKRGEAVRRALSLMGVPDSQMEVVSFGKEKPKALGHDETSWAENRRVDLAYPQ